MKTVKIVGVPEHFNLPWQLSIENGDFEKEGINLEWEDIPEGSGKMCQMLRNAEADIAIVLSEAIVKDIISGNPSSIVQVYVETPLVWGIHVAAASNYKKVADIEGKKIAISRMGSGSHLMAIVNAKKQGWNIENLSFEIINTVDGAVEALTNNKADYFLWEQFTTKPLVDKGIFRKIGTCPSPWPCFVVAISNEVLEKEPKLIAKILEVINTTTTEFKEIPSIDKTIALEYNQKIEDIKQWLAITEWSQKKLTKKEFDIIQNQLFELNIIDKKVTFETIVK
jgi:ABC-type nitrate/sulfonate/bicarbonate transport system substrate-binding protein